MGMKNNSETKLKRSIMARYMIEHSHNGRMPKVLMKTAKGRIR
jgi:hypothetical protein